MHRQIYPSGGRWLAEVPIVGAKSFSSRKFSPWEMKRWNEMITEHNSICSFTLWVIALQIHLPPNKSLAYFLLPTPPTSLVTQTKQLPLSLAPSPPPLFFGQWSIKYCWFSFWDIFQIHPFLSFLGVSALTLYHFTFYTIYTFNSIPFVIWTVVGNKLVIGWSSCLQFSNPFSTFLAARISL